ncbi:Aste57867_12565 [Aphanomyces stellatus]|uniref:Aste57867_12565 protein n=1 Tax=Aphanomyces stellatus TaxID=120398 RepID=A0A485KXW9_9STRA|nr:hypothetical protein As57867_012519 [Aphanomyces stellatus]VFT89416.1 Aste57867_12565 [Aphanomyces stellatus]
MRSLLYLFALLATASARRVGLADPTSCLYTNWTANAIQTYNPTTAQFEIVDAKCKVLPNTTTFQAVGDIQSFPGKRLEYKDMPELIDVEHAFWPTTMTSMLLQNIGATSLSDLTRGWINWRVQTVYHKTFERLELIDMAIDALPAQLPRFKMSIIAQNVSVGKLASFGSIDPLWMELNAMKNLEFHDIGFESLRFMSISYTKIKSLSNVTVNSLQTWRLNNIAIGSMTNIQLQPLQLFWINNTSISNWTMNATTYQALESMPKTVWGPLGDGYGFTQGWMVNNTFFLYDKAVCDKQGGTLKTLWSQANLAVCVLNLPTNGGGSSSVGSSNNTGTIVAVSAGCVALLVAVLVTWHRKKAATANSAQPVLTVKTID